MKFCNRKEKLKELTAIYNQTSQGGWMTVLSGRRRVGKTVLATEFVRRTSHLCLFLSKKSEPLLCQDFLGQIQQAFKIPVIGGYIDRLENNYAILSKFLPIDAKPDGRRIRYRIQDNFLNFWFRFIYRNMLAVETGNFHYIKKRSAQRNSFT
ncbi:MAG: ATP-binding protein [Sedimentisphaerales bacterium]|nr:ATP-binding protein [Sedimentisphaerales bacterium]